jgi:hypothetical protein
MHSAAAPCPGVQFNQPNFSGNQTSRFQLQGSAPPQFWKKFEAWRLKIPGSLAASFLGWPLFQFREAAATKDIKK